MVCLLFGVAVFLRVMLADRHPLWADEFFSLAMATGHSLEHPASAAVPSLGDFVEEPGAVPAAKYRRYLEHEAPPAAIGRVVRAVMLSDTSPPLYYVLLHGWTRVLGTSDRLLSLFSVLWAVATFPFLYLLGQQLGGPRAALSACLLYTFAPLSLYYSVEGRMYSLVWFLSAATAWTALQIHCRGARPATLFPWVLAGVTGLFTHYFYAFVWAACAGWLFLWPGRSPRRWVFAGAVLTGLVVLPWYLQVPESLARWRITGHWLDGSLTLSQVLSAPFLLGWNLLSGRGAWGGIKWIDRIGALVVLAVALVTFFREPGTMFSRPMRLLWLWVAAACIGPPVFDLIRGTQTSLIQRYALAGLPGAILLVSVMVGRLRPLPNAVAVTLLVAAWLPGLRGVFGDSSRQWRPFRAAAERVAAWAGPSDLVIVHSIPSGIAGIARYLPAGTPVAGWVGQLGQRRMPEDIRALSMGRRRIALITIHEVGAPAPEADWLRAHAGSIEEFAYSNARVLYFSAVAGTADAAGGAGTTRR